MTTSTNMKPNMKPTPRNTGSTTLTITEIDRPRPTNVSGGAGRGQT